MMTVRAETGNRFPEGSLTLHCKFNKHKNGYTLNWTINLLHVKMTLPEWRWTTLNEAQETRDIFKFISERKKRPSKPDFLDGTKGCQGFDCDLAGSRGAGFLVSPENGKLSRYKTWQHWIFSRRCYNSTFFFWLGSARGGTTVAVTGHQFCLARSVSCYYKPQFTDFNRTLHTNRERTCNMPRRCRTDSYIWRNMFPLPGTNLWFFKNTYQLPYVFIFVGNQFAFYIDVYLF